MRLGAVVLLGLLAGCSGAADEEDADVSAGEGAILGGQSDTGDPAVGMVRLPTGQFGSGTLIAPSTVLTAGHVVAGKPTQFFYGTPPAGKDARFDVLSVASIADVAAHPCYTDPSKCGGQKVDVAVLHLAAPIRDVAPIAIVDQPLEYLWGLLSPYEGDSCTAIGFGAHLQGSRATLQVRRSARATIDDVGIVELVTVWGTGIATGGDSGGPLVCAGRIVGTVRGSAGAVPSNSPYTRTREAYVRTDAHRDWIREQMR